ncbi:MAG TPA: LacI family transcriptional regulator, partial [Firmicutes bacterium]|nr:LacI family transcriptional regulator [Bacillota bacterium]
MATIRQVAARAGVSVATVSAVITGKRRVSEELRNKVQIAMEELNYHPNALARAL